MSVRTVTFNGDDISVVDDLEPDYTEAPEVKATALEIIREHHQHLASANIGYMFRNTKSWKSQGQDIRGKAYKVTGWQAAATGWDFLIMIYRPAWDEMDEDTRLALVDHELMHCGLDANHNWTIHGHDFEDFLAVVKRHGAWKEPLRRLETEMRQLSVFEGGRP